MTMISWDSLIKTAEPYPEIKSFLLALKEDTNMEIEDGSDSESGHIPIDVRGFIHELYDIVFNNDLEDRETRYKLKEVVIYLTTKRPKK